MLNKCGVLFVFEINNIFPIFLVADFFYLFFYYFYYLFFYYFYFLFLFYFYFIFILIFYFIFYFFYTSTQIFSKMQLLLSAATISESGSNPKQETSEY